MVPDCCVNLCNSWLKNYALLINVGPSKGHVYFYQTVPILGQEIGSVNIALANPTDEDDPWYIISDEPTSLTTLAEYALRFDIKEGFLDDKSGGF
jgi:hypothetical protein